MDCCSETASKAVAVLGAGAWGTAIAIALAEGGRPVRLYARRPEHAAQMQRQRKNAARLPGHAFPPSVSVTASLENAVGGADSVFLVAPSCAIEELARDAADVAAAGTPFVLCAKGLAGNGAFLTDLIAAIWRKGPVLVLSGPSFAHEVAARKHTIVSLSGPPDVARRLCSELASKEFVIAPCSDHRGVQLAGVFKNVAAILCGASDGLQGGANARAALMSEAIREASDLVSASGGNQATLLGPAGFGDFALTCTDAQSRNYRLGRRIAIGGDTGSGTTQEGAANAATLLRRARQLDVDVPLVEAVVDLVEGKINAREAVHVAFAQRLAKSRRLRHAA